MDAGARALRGSPPRGAVTPSRSQPFRTAPGVTGLWGWITGQPLSLGASAADGARTRVGVGATRRRRDGGAARPGSHLSPVRREAPPVVEPADEESVIEIPRKCSPSKASTRSKLN